MYFYDWSWELLKELFLPIKEIMCVCIQEIIDKKQNKTKQIAKLRMFLMRIFFFVPIYLKKLCKSDCQVRPDRSELRIFEMSLKWQLRNSRMWKVRTAGYALTWDCEHRLQQIWVICQTFLLKLICFWKLKDEALILSLNHRLPSNRRGLKSVRIGHLLVGLFSLLLNMPLC